MRKHLYEYIYLTRQERNGLLVIILLSGFISFLPMVYSFLEKRETADFSIFQNEIQSFFEADETQPTIAFPNTYFHKKENEHFEKRAIELFNFDPNIASKEEFIRLGISPKTAQTILNFRSKGANFFKNEDFKKVYGLKNEDYERLKNFIKIEQKEKTNTSIASNDIPESYASIEVKHTPFDPNTANENILLQNGIPSHVAKTIIKYRSSGARFETKEDLKKIYTLKEDIYQKIEPYIQIIPQEKRTIIKASASRGAFAKEEIKNKTITIDINKATPEEWQQLSGIGPSFSNRIVKFRDKLGGFYSIEQVGETYGLPDSTFQNIKLQLQPSSIFKKINLNQATEEQLKKHPYISWNQAKLIISFRKMHGGFENVNELLQIKALDKKWLAKIKHYFVL